MEREHKGPCTYIAELSDCFVFLSWYTDYWNGFELSELILFSFIEQLLINCKY